MAHIASVARTCYQSFDKATEETDQRLFEILGEKGHTAMYEHYVAYFFAEQGLPSGDLDIISPYIEYEGEYIAINLRTLYEYKNLDILENLFQQIASGENGHNEYFTQVDRSEAPESIWSYTIRCTTNRGISHELVRHRKCSFAQESTRYCAYREYLRICLFSLLTHDEFVAQIDVSDYAFEQYRNLLANGHSAQTARDVLPHTTAVDIVLTTSSKWWTHLLSLREAPAAHPMARELAGFIRRELHDESPTSF